MRRIGGIVLIVLLVLVACGPEPETALEAAPATTTTEAQPTTTTWTSTTTSTTSTTSTTTTTVVRVTTTVARVTTTAPPVARLVPTTGAAGGACDPNYAGACVPIASDVDCGGGSGNGPAYVYAKNFRVVGEDIYGLDGSDNDGLACES